MWPADRSVSRRPERARIRASASKVEAMRVCAWRRKPRSFSRSFDTSIGCTFGNRSGDRPGSQSRHQLTQSRPIVIDERTQRDDLRFRSVCAVQHVRLELILRGDSQSRDFVFAGRDAVERARPASAGLSASQQTIRGKIVHGHRDHEPVRRINSQLPTSNSQAAPVMPLARVRSRSATPPGRIRTH